MLLPGRGMGLKRDFIACAFAVFLHDHGIRTLGQGSAGVNPGGLIALPVLSFYHRHGVGRRSNEVRCSDGISIHGGVVEDRLIEDSVHSLARDAPIRLFHRHYLAVGHSPR